MQNVPRARPRILLGCLASAGLASVVVAQQNSVHPQPRAEALPSPATATANSNDECRNPREPCRQSLPDSRWPATRSCEGRG